MKTTGYFARSLGVCCILAIAAGVSVVPAQDATPKKDNANDPSRPLPEMGRLRDVGISSDGKLAVAGDSNRTIWVWDVPKRKLIRAVPDPFTSHDTAPCYAFSADGRFAVVGNQTGTQRQGWGVREPDHERLTFWDLSAGVKLRAFDVKDESVCAVALSHDGTRAVSVSLRKVVIGKVTAKHEFGEPRYYFSLRLWDTSNGKALRTLSDDWNSSSVSFSRDGKSLASLLLPPISPPGLFLDPMDKKMPWELWKWEASAGQGLPRVSMAAEWPRMEATCFTFSPDGKHLAIGSGFEGVSLWNLETGTRIWRRHDGFSTIRDGKVIGHWPVKSVAFSPDGKHIVAAGAGAHGIGGIVMVEALTGKQVPGFAAKDTWVGCVSFTPNGEMLLGATFDGLRFWQAKTGNTGFTLNN